jgi:hypothetical protein
VIAKIFKLQGGRGKAYTIPNEVIMLTLHIKDHTLEKQLSELLQQKFNGNSDEMLQELVKTYTAQLNRLKYNGILKWEKDGLAFQKEIRNEWQ